MCPLYPIISYDIQIFHPLGGCECACCCVFRKPISIPFLVWQQIGHLKEPIKLTARICKTFGHFHLFYIYIYYYFPWLLLCEFLWLPFFLIFRFVCSCPSSQFHFVSFCWTGTADMTWTVVYLLFLCASVSILLLSILFISLTHANICMSANQVIHTYLCTYMFETLVRRVVVYCQLYVAFISQLFSFILSLYLPLPAASQFLFIYLFMLLVFIAWQFFVHMIEWTTSSFLFPFCLLNKSVFKEL